MAWLPYADALARVLASATPTATEERAVDEALGHVLAEDVVFPLDLPPFPHAAMDGYAIPGAAANGARFVVHGESRAGAPLARAEPGRAIAISTGAVLPDAVDTVVPWEHVTRDGDAIVLTRDASRAQHVRHAGEDARAGTTAVAAGTRLGPRHLGPLVTAERATVRVARAPRVALLLTGDELRAPGAADTPGSVVDSNTPMLAALSAQAGATTSAMHVPDRDGALEAAIRASDADVVVTVGGAADGDHDHVARALVALSADLVFRGVAIKPGKPVALARLGTRPLLALPGNPGSAFVTFLLLGVPLLRAMQRDARAAPPFAHARSDAPLRGAKDRLAALYGALTTREDGTLRFVPHAAAASGAVPPLAGASALALVDAGTTVERDGVVRVLDVERA